MVKCLGENGDQINKKERERDVLLIFHLDQHVIRESYYAFNHNFSLRAITAMPTKHTLLRRNVSDRCM